jgi:hypothetical protein
MSEGENRYTPSPERVMIQDLHEAINLQKKEIRKKYARSKYLIERYENHQDALRRKNDLALEIMLIESEIGKLESMVSIGGEKKDVPINNKITELHEASDRLGDKMIELSNTEDRFRKELDEAKSKHDNDQLADLKTYREEIKSMIEEMKSKFSPGASGGAN